MYSIYFLHNYNFIYYEYFLLNIYIFNYNIQYIFFIDNLSLLLIFLTSILYIISLLVIWNITYYYKILNILIFFVIIFVILSFCVLDLLLFYIFFEIILIPMFLIIGIWGSRERKITAAYRFFLYTLFGSIFFLVVIIYFYFLIGTTDVIKLLIYNNLAKNLQKIFWFCCFITFAVKIPLFPLHTWLPEAHAEAPTVGSILLAGILLKLGPYGLIRFINLLFPYGLITFKPFIFFLCLLSIYYTSITAIRQLDIKKIIAYSSIGHMALILLGLISNTIEGFIGSFILLLAHGFVSGGLFLLIGCIYDRYKTRIILYYNGLAQINPKIAFFFFLLLLGNIAFPGTLNFISEFCILISLIDLNYYLLFLIGLSSIFILTYNLFLFSKLFFFFENKNYSIYKVDLSFREIIIVLIFLFPIYFWGVFGSSLVNFMYENSLFYLFIYNFIIN
jgi:proton-translocating NADH-quinone oxidoreductase chain M